MISLSKFRITTRDPYVSIEVAWIAHQLLKPDSLVWQTRQSDFVRELTTKHIQLTYIHFINKSKI
jgi:hypothetical protein